MSKLIESALGHAWPIQWYDTLDSTNIEAKRRSETQDVGPCWIAAKKQTKGKGRLGRSWMSDQGNLAATALFPFDAPISLVSKLSFLTGLAVLDAIKASGEDITELKLKWPNDVRYKKKKLCGILIESGKIADGYYWVAAGIGVNIKIAPNVDQPTTSLAEVFPNLDINSARFLEELNIAFGKRLKTLIEFGFDSIKKDWTLSAEALDEQVSVQDRHTLVNGVMRGIDEDGALLLETSSGEITKIVTGDVLIA